MMKMDSFKALCCFLLIVAVLGFCFGAPMNRSEDPEGELKNLTSLNSSAMKNISIKITDEQVPIIEQPPEYQQEVDPPKGILIEQPDNTHTAYGLEYSDDDNDFELEFKDKTETVIYPLQLPRIELDDYELKDVLIPEPHLSATDLGGKYEFEYTIGKLKVEDQRI